MGKQPRDKWLTINGLSFHYRDWGGGGQGIILLHGLASTCRIWDLVAPIMAQDGHRVVAMDQRGHGASAKPEQGYDFATVSRDLAGLIEGLGMERPLIVGHSWGADVALEFAAANPEVPKGLCFVDGGMIQPSARYTSLDQAREQMAPPIFSGVTLEAFYPASPVPAGINTIEPGSRSCGTGQLRGSAGQHHSRLAKPG